MELAKFLRIIARNKYILIAVPLVTVIITFFLVRKLPNQYASTCRIATGIVDQTQPQLQDNIFMQESKINQEFSNLIEMMQLKRIIDQVSYKLILHDLTSDKPFKPLSQEIKDLNTAAKKHAIEVYQAKMQKHEPLFLWDNDQKGLSRVITSMGYDEASIKENLLIYRVTSSDFIQVYFKSVNPDLSAFVVNHLSDEFIVYYASLKRENQFKAVNFLDSLLKVKEAAMNNNIAELKTYKIQNRVLNLNEQAKSLYNQGADFEVKKEMAHKDVISYNAAIENIDKKFSPQERSYLESSLTKINQEVLATKEQLKRTTDEYIKSNYDSKYKTKVDSLQNVLAAQVNASTDKYLYNPLAVKQNLVTQKLNLEISRDLAENSIQSLQKEIERINKKFDLLVPHEAVIQGLENAIGVSREEYIEILKKYNQANMESKFNIVLRQVEVAMPSDPEPSKKMLLVALSGIVSFVFCMLVFFVIFYFDHTIQTPKELANVTGLPVLGYVNKLKIHSLEEVNSLWGKSVNDTNNHYRDLVRSVRFEIDNELNSNNKVLALTSLLPNEGKSFIALSLANAYALMNKKVLLIDGQFMNQSVTAVEKPKLTVEQLLANPSLQHIESDAYSVVGNSNSDKSLLEISDAATVSAMLQQLKSVYDIVLIDISSVNELNKAKEWILFADKVLAVYEANHALNNQKKEEILYLKQTGKFIGWVLNKYSVKENLQHSKKS